MPLSFANPALLFGSLAAALPVVIHLISRRRVRRQPFSDLRFLGAVQSQQSRSLGLRRWLLLLLRVLALLLIALAAAQPRWGGLAASGRGARSVLFVLDASASMQTQQQESTRFDVALAELDRMIAALPEDASVQVMTAGAETAMRFDDWLPAGAVHGAVRDLAVSDGALNEAAWLREAARQVSRAPGLPVEVVVLSDLQPGAGADDLPALSEAAERLRRAGAARVLLRKIGQPTPGGGVLGLQLPGRAVLPGENIGLRATVSTDATEEVFRLELDGRMVAETSSSADRAGPGMQVLEFAVRVPGTGIHRGRIHKQSDSFGADDERPFVLKVPRALRVLLVHGADRAVDGPAGRGGWRFVARALAPDAGEGAFTVRPVPTGELTTAALGACDVAVMVDPDPLGRQALGGLQRWLEAGGAAFFVLGEATSADYVARTLLPRLELPRKAEWRSSGRLPGQRLQVIDPGHPVFAGLEEDALATLGEARARGWLAVEEGQQRVLLALTGEDPLLIEGSVGAGSYALLTCHLDPAATDLAANPMVLPLLQRLTAWLANRSRLNDVVNTVVGDEAIVRPQADPGALENPDDLRVITPDGIRTARLDWLGEAPALSAGVITRAGFTVFMAGPDTVGLIAAGVPPVESARELETVAERSARWSGAGLPVAGDLTDADPDTWTAVLAGADLTAWFLLLAVALLVLETVLGRGARAEG